MANNSINGRFRELYKEVEDNLSDESKIFLNALYKRGSKFLHEYRNNVLENLNEKYLKIINDLAVEYDISVDEIEYRMTGNQWDCYIIALEKLNEHIYNYRSKKAINKEYEEILESIRNQSDEEVAYWQELRNAVNRFPDENDEELLDDYEDDEEYPDEEFKRDMYVSKIKNILEDRLTTAIHETKNELNITGQVINFMLNIYDIGQRFILV